MAATVFYVEALPDGGVAELTGPDGHHAARVLRLRVGEKIVLSDGLGGLASTVVSAVDRDTVSLDVVSRKTADRVRPAVTVVQALPKSERAELAVDLAVEAGADVLIPWQASRSITQWKGEKATAGVRKWQAVARSAAQQARRPYLPVVSELVSTKQLLDQVRAFDGLVLALHESASTRMADVDLDVPAVMLIVGPEGGIADGEIASLREAGAVPVLLGPNVLRSVTAASVALGAIGVRTGRWDAAPVEWIG
ncbi:MAG: 16S rRNA (uracil(1498)-N(3))-methyltransferase [Nocardiaceae bacterium]|nr:16S rRNA (uracil(1498)-N(3))-methyltransferase [Nocardiaceae bacterium]